MMIAIIATIGLASDSEADHSSPQRLNDVIGFGSSGHETVRDDKIALWEAFQRARYTEQCMADAGFDYIVEVLFPAGSIPGIASSLNLEERHGTVRPADQTQDSYEDTLSETERDRYYRTLWGESAEDIDFAASTGYLPEGRNDFATGGCAGAAWDVLPSMHSLRRAIVGEMIEAKQVEDAKSEPCFLSDGTRLDGLGDLEEVLADAPSWDEAEKQHAECREHLEAENQAARERANKTVFDRYRQRLHEHHDYYRTVLEEIASDEEFKRYVARHLERIEPEPVPIPHE